MSRVERQILTAMKFKILELTLLVILIASLASTAACSGKDKEPGEGSEPPPAEAPAEAASESSEAGPDLGEKIRHAIDLLDNDDSSKKREGLAMINEIGNPALQPLMDHVSSKAPWVLAWFYYLDAEQFAREYANPAAFMAEYYIKNDYFPVSDLPEGEAGESVMRIVNRLKDTGDEESSLVARGLKNYGDQIQVTDVFIKGKIVDAEEIQVDHYLIVGTCREISSSNTEHFHVMINGAGSSVREASVHRPR